MLVEREQVLDLANRMTEGSREEPSDQQQEISEMFDPAAIGTTMIGLHRIRREEERFARGVAVPDRPRSRSHGPVRHGFAATLRLAAERIDPHVESTRRIGA